MSTKVSGRRTGAGIPGTAEREAIGGKPTSAPILPKVAGWTPARRSYRQARLALAQSLRWLGSEDKPFGFKHFCIYQQFTDGLYPYFPVRRVWEAAKQDGVVFSEVLRRWASLDEIYRFAERRRR